MECTKCHAVNEVSASRCEKCGAPLQFYERSDHFWGRLIFTIFTVLLAGVVLFNYFTREPVPPSGQAAEQMFAVDTQKDEKREEEKRKKPVRKQRPDVMAQAAVEGKGRDVTTKADDMSPEALSSEKEAVAGWVTITDPWGRQVTKFRAGFAGNGWLALPARACLGGKIWHFSRDAGGEAEISGGMWVFGDVAGLWHISKGTGSFHGPELAAWNESEPVSWFSLDSSQEYQSIMLNSRRNEGYFRSASLPDYVNETGMFIQSGKIVGWSFGQWLPGAYMWTGTELKDKTWVRNFYNITFANGREEKFAMALALEKGHAGLDQLASLVEGFRLQPKLTMEDTPSYLLPGEITKKISDLVVYAVNHGGGGQVVNILNSQMLKHIGDINVFMNVVPAIVTARGFEVAISEIEDTGTYIERQIGHDVPALDELHVKLYQDWLQSLVSAQDVDEGWLTYNSAKVYYPDDPYIHLLGVELALMNGDWEAAERLLYMRSYPPDFQDRVQLLASLISEMKGKEGKIVINYPHGSNKIPVTATINGALDQDFLVDTGASIVIIPSSTAENLGLETYGGRHRVSTVGGVVMAHEVIIDTIEIEGWVEYDVRALVVDIPDRPGLGLLGMNYLNRFDRETSDGTLLLTPR
jgi:clan AA aspartic protease (TIGR02281 family)